MRSSIGGQAMMILFCVLALAASVAFYLMAYNTAAHDLQKRYDDFALGAKSALDKVENSNTAYETMEKRVQTAEQNLAELKQKFEKSNRSADISMAVQLPDKPILVEVIDKTPVPPSVRIPLRDRIGMKPHSQSPKKSHRKALTQ